MKIYNYSDQPIVWQGTSIDSQEVTLPRSESFTFGSANYTDKQSGDDVEAYFLYGSGGTMGATWTYESRDMDHIPAFTVLFITCFFFCILVKVVQKLRTRG